MTGAPATAGYKREPGVAVATLPAPLREIGFDQNLDQHAAARHAVPRRSRARPCSSATTSASGRSCWCSPTTTARCCARRCSTASRARSTCCRSNPGKDFEIVTVSFDPRDTPATAAAKKAAYLERYQRPGAAAGWHFLTGDQPSIERLTKAAGFRYVWDEETKQFAHPTGIIVLTPDGRLARYLFGIEYGPRDLRLALVEASEGKVGTPRRRAAALLLSLRPDDRPLRLRRSCARCASPASPPCSRSARSSSSWCDASGEPAPGTRAPGTRHSARGTR